MAAPLARLALAALWQALLASASNPHATLGSYQPVSNVIEHSQMVLDVEAINNAARDWTTSKSVYTEGQNSCKSTTNVRTLQGFVSQQTATDKLIGEAFFDTFTDGTGPNAANGIIPGNGRLMLSQDFWDQFLLDALDNTGDFPALDDTVRDAMREVAVKKGVLGILTMYTTHEMESAISKAVAGNVADDTGAPHAWDEAWAFYYGSYPDGEYSAWEFTKKRDNDFCVAADSSPVAGCIRGSDVILDYFLQGLKGSRDGTLDTAEMILARNNIYRILALSSIRAALKYAWKAQQPKYSHEYHMEAYAYFLAAAGWVEQAKLGAGKAVLDLVDWRISSADLNSDLYCAVQAALVPSYEPLGLDCTMVGTYNGVDVFKTCSPEPTCPATAILPDGLTTYEPDTDTDAGSNVDCDPADAEDANGARRTSFAFLALGVPAACLQLGLQKIS